ncbi:thiosulfate/3-mercaptopyruvate sulfurtransferase [Paenibacillus phyllosphaerae]|uniref:Thiosulfate/3-mercaptopyruvate sulfurtransferase n=1 Tax=Paenibacillus phyllosphaerae TaxID=274593 RepID=A0A7W5B3L9_9BACL|nr:sulfurtransferase [Paenibacillus phyllosphaerae]MBB3113797.1 thiosulfate/3-mercaptopyruvate sulfurtransferase [Paenibacillus phyllosphaerae]
MNAVVPVKWVLARMYEPDIVIVDCRFTLGKPESGRAAYEEAHIPGAIYLDLEQDLSGPVEADGSGGRHPLPDPATLAARLGRAGISNESRVVAYDDQGGAMASRLWWLMKYLGHDNVFVMDGGFKAWTEANFPVTAEQRITIPAQFLATVQHNLLSEVYDVQDVVAGTKSATLIDSREPARYRGEVEPIDPVAGHIPGAKNVLWAEGRGADGLWKSTEEQAARFEGLSVNKDDEIIVYCGSGVTATPNVMALLEAGYTNVKLYAGSWSDWVSDKENPVATGDE